MSFTTVAIIFNPISTGSSETLAKQFADELKQRLPKQKVELIGTKYARHAEELAYSIAKNSKRPLIISSSGDGGYNEIINGALRAQKEGATPVTGLLPAGNANDHYRNLHTEDLIEQIVKGTTRKIDVLTLTSVSKEESFTRHAHSYIGFGLTPHVGEELNKTKLNIFKETWLVLRVVFTLKAVPLVINGKKHAYDSIIMSNVDTMSKYFTISQPSRMADGKFEVTMFRRKNKLQLIALLLRASLSGVKEDLQTALFSLKTVTKTLVQLDGEIVEIDPNTAVTIGIEKQRLTCLV